MMQMAMYPHQVNGTRGLAEEIQRWYHPGTAIVVAVPYGATIDALQAQLSGIHVHDYDLRARRTTPSNYYALAAGVRAYAKDTAATVVLWCCCETPVLRPLRMACTDMVTLCAEPVSGEGANITWRVVVDNTRSYKKSILDPNL